MILDLYTGAAGRATGAGLLCTLTGRVSSAYHAAGGVA